MGDTTTASMEESTPSTATAVSALPKNANLPELPRAPTLLFGNAVQDKKLYWDRSHYPAPDEQMKALVKSSTLYLGNLSFSTRSAQIRSHFSTVGPIRTIHMGVNRQFNTPCGFAFVEYYQRRHALLAIAFLSGTKLDGNVIRVESDAGFQEGRQFGRGKSGGQVRHDSRQRRFGHGGGSGGNYNHNSSGPPAPSPYTPSAPSYYSSSDPPSGPGGASADDVDMDAQAMERNPRFRED
eukprot:Nitzschia sp. Nitz4//scaffold153_size53422//52502//53215//NITZ4_006768-RA/size53422-processed-gene-0.18-mRNA-1//1//CDS//3329537283//6390//frame0